MGPDNKINVNVCTLVVCFFDSWNSVFGMFWQPTRSPYKIAESVLLL